MHHFDINNIDAHPVRTGIVGFVLGIGKNTIDMMDGAAALDWSKISDTFLLGFIGAAGSLTLTLIVKLVKYIIAKRKEKQDVKKV